MLIEIPAAILPHTKNGWQHYPNTGWNIPTFRTKDRPAAVHSSARLANLTINATAPADRQITLEAWLVSKVAAPLELRLNGVLLDTLNITATPSEFSVAAPQAAWHLGSNEIEFSLPADAFQVGADKMSHGFALSKLSYGSAQEVRPTTNGFSLSPGTGLRYFLEERSATQLTVRAHAEAAGECEITTRFVSPSDMLSAADRTASPAIRRGLTPGSNEFSLTLPPAYGALLEVELLWNSTGELNLTAMQIEEAAPPTQPSIILISIDTLGAGHTSLYGNERPTSPHLDAFAKQATVFENCSSNAPWTMPSYAALMSGYYPSSARFSPNLTSTHFAFMFPDVRWTLAESLSAAGYRTGAFIDTPNVGSRIGFAQGFDVFDESALDYQHGALHGGLKATSQAALAWLDTLQATGTDQPYFMFVHANDVHGPYQPKPEERGRFQRPPSESNQAPLPTGSFSGVYGQVPQYLLGSAIGEHNPKAAALPVDPFIAAYDESIVSMDKRLGTFLDELAKRGALDDAIIIFTADHGEAFGEHNMLGHGQLYDEVIAVPLVISLPNHLRTDAQPAHVSQPVQLVDLYPTLIDYAGLATERTDLHGRSLRPLLADGESELAAVYSEGGVMRQSSITHGQWKLIEKWPSEDTMPWAMMTNPLLDRDWLKSQSTKAASSVMNTAGVLKIADDITDAESFYDAMRAQLAGAVYELYDLDQDPQEQSNLAGQRPEIQRSLMDHLNQAKQKLREARIRATESRVEFSAAELDKLKSLGY